MRKVVIAFALLAGACATPPIDSYCEKKQLELIDFTDPGLHGLNPHNKRAVIVGDNTWKRDCVGKSNAELVEAIDL